MNGQTGFERRIADYYASEGLTRAPDRVLHFALATIESTSQRRVLVPAPWRTLGMTSFARLAIVATAAIVVAALALGLFTNSIPGVGTPSTPTPSPSPSPSPSPIGGTGLVLSQTFTSGRHGLSLKYPGGWQVRNASAAWVSGIPLYVQDHSDVMFDDTTADLKFISAASRLLGDTRGDAWINDLAADRQWEDRCPPTTTPVNVDGAAGVLVEWCPGVARVAIVATEDRGYAIALYGVTDDEFVRAVLDTVQLSPDSALNN